MKNDNFENEFQEGDNQTPDSNEVDSSEPNNSLPAIDFPPLEILDTLPDNYTRDENEPIINPEKRELQSIKPITAADLGIETDPNFNWEIDLLEEDAEVPSPEELLGQTQLMPSITDEDVIDHTSIVEANKPDNTKVIENTSHKSSNVEKESEDNSKPTKSESALNSNFLSNLFSRKNN